MNPTIADLQSWRQNKNYDSMLAICMECGAVRRAKRPRNRNYDTNTGDLKCANCQKITAHSLVTGNSHDETRYARALGMPDDNGRTWDHVIDEYREGFTVNPELDHWYRVAERDAARERGETRIRAHCGEIIEIAPKGKGVTLAVGEAAIPTGDTLDGRSYDPDDHGQWRKMDCPNCLRVINHNRAVSRRKVLAELMTTALAELLDRPRSHIYDEHSEALIAALKAVHGEGR